MILDLYSGVLILLSYLCFIFCFLVELKKQISCSMLLTNKSDNYVAFKVKKIVFFLSFIFAYLSALKISDEQLEKLECSCICLVLTFMYYFHRNIQVKTTNPKKYCVRPNTGVVVPHSTCDVIGLFHSICMHNFFLHFVSRVSPTWFINWSIIVVELENIIQK